VSGRRVSGCFALFTNKRDVQLRSTLVSTLRLRASSYASIHSSAARTTFFGASKALPMFFVEIDEHSQQPEMTRRNRRSKQVKGNSKLMKNRNVVFPAALLAISILALYSIAQAVSPAPDGGYPGGNTAEGHNALLSLATGGFNTAVGLLSLRNGTTGNLNTGVGAGVLLANTADSNTATGAGALLNNTTAGPNTANGAFALFSNTTGNNNNAFGYQALFSNTTGPFNNALGNGDGNPYAVRYDQVNAMLLNEFLKEHKTVEEQRATIAELKWTVTKQQRSLESKLAEQKIQIDALQSGLQKVRAHLELSRPIPRMAVSDP
jgi:hypothetical protein